jgi:hypothetical protein
MVARVRAHSCFAGGGVVADEPHDGSRRRRPRRPPSWSRSPAIRCPALARRRPTRVAVPFAGQRGRDDGPAHRRPRPAWPGRSPARSPRLRGQSAARPARWPGRGLPARSWRRAGSVAADQRQAGPPGGEHHHPVSGRQGRPAPGEPRPADPPPARLTTRSTPSEPIMASPSPPVATWLPSRPEPGSRHPPHRAGRRAQAGDPCVAAGLSPGLGTATNGSRCGRVT